ncbi:MAG: 50S ribosomal protein L25 [Candidatus Woesebacteria bacterium GW2011_GWA1_37_7]|uniref:Large ribosomal subunit protein bL25 n=1 Tax=Candidatus Woesebacteria bacterium GW2011_GWA1_37_7 TaxID=1618545 RepID=A0A0G0H1R9_9BACT|nr:MAG: 50S ribosomal protein L25 [Candidatus Woesebacteria bacterium GW2011_GWA1_37_7]
MAKLVLEAQERKETGRKVKRLRKQGILPANIYGNKVKSLAISVSLDDFKKIFKEAGETNVIELKVGKDTRPVLIHNLQVDPVSDIPIHADLLQVDLKVKVTAKIPVVLVGESPAEKQGLGIVVQYIDEVEVEALPMDLPEKFELDATKLENIDGQYQVKDLVYEKSKITVSDDPENVIAKIEESKKEEEIVEEKPTEEVGEEITTEEKVEDEESSSKEQS